MIDWTFLGLIAGMLTTLSYVPQIVKGVRTKHLDDISLAMVVVLGTGFVFWTVYGVVLNNLPLIFWDMVSLSLVLVIIYLKLKYRSSEATTPAVG